MDSNIQELDVIYSDEQITCEICLEKKESNGNIAKLSKCNHCFHIKCLINYCCKNTSKCPTCNMVINDNRISFAVAFKNGNSIDVMNILTYNKYNIKSLH